MLELEVWQVDLFTCVGQHLSHKHEQEHEHEHKHKSNVSTTMFSLRLDRKNI